MELISGKDAAIRYLNGENVLHLNKELVGFNNQWADCKRMNIDDFKNDRWAFKLEPKTVEINGVKILIPNNIVIDAVTGSVGLVYGDVEKSKQMVEALRSIFDAK